MKKILLSADDPIHVYSVPDAVAADLDGYCRDFYEWMKKSPEASALRTDFGNGSVGYCYSEEDFIDYLNKYVCEEKSTLVAVIDGAFDLEQVPEEYGDLPYYGF